ncbi:hypothetical protein SDRG_09624 [Saprolegnia diclina VS20]|uniref:Uncharacterized protein n=1 Tax=Saprolegnia diclina (strain VS20) TaxID=1156394 RepID=T0RK41_SAPDV|nr:hypothetical protein SDRG_09624 [Saprolegnia diclina VS20]EQC32648.1 hypothetical protein SDRG_09624 [Saprolegnia diclina VS20]|eukprot:XP_008613792.1 hypothetical protein SDRG_09624 [Saprolegnia diclina VS20]
MDAIRAALRLPVQAVAAKEAARDEASEKRAVASYGYMFASCSQGTYACTESQERALVALLRRHHASLRLRGQVTTASSVQLHAIAFVAGQYAGSALDISALAPFSLRLRIDALHVAADAQLIVLQVAVDPTEGLVCIHEPKAWFPDDAACMLWTPGCKFGGFTFPSTPFTPQHTPGPTAFNDSLVRDPTRHNLYAFDGMLQTFQVPAVTSYIVRPPLYSDDALSYKSLSVQQMRMWATDRRKQANSLRRDGKVTEAIAEYSSAIEMDPDDGETYYARALLYLHEKHSDAARSDLQKVLSLNPVHAMATEKLRGLGRGLSEMATTAATPDPQRLLHLLQDELKARKKEKKPKKEHKNKDHRRRSKERKRRRSESPPAHRRSSSRYSR